MPVSDSWLEETAKDIIREYETLLCNNDTKINNEDEKDNVFEEGSYINVKDYENLKKEIVRQLRNLTDYVELETRNAA